MLREKRIFRALFLCVLFLIGTIVVSHAETQGELDGLPWFMDDQGKLTVRGNGTLSESAFIDQLDISSAWIGEGITEINNFAFARCRNMESLYLPQSLQRFGVNVITDCTRLQSIDVAANNPYFASADGVLYDKNQKKLLAYPGGKKTAMLPKSLETIGMYAFSGAAVEEMILPEGLKKIENGALGSLPELTSIEIPAGVTTLGDAIFAESSMLTSVTFLNKADALPMSTFASCAKLEEVVLPKGIKTIEKYAFQSCVSLKSIEIPDTVEQIEEYAFHHCIRLSYIELPDSLQSIGERVFQNNFELKSITIPSNVSFIGNGAFFGCTSLTDVYYQGTAEQWAAITIDADNSSLLEANIHYGAEMPDSSKETHHEETLTVPSIYGDMIWTDHSITWGEGTVEWNYDESSRTLTLSGAGKIPPMNADNCEGWKIYDQKTEHLIIRKGITGIGFQAFSTFRRLETVSLPAGLGQIDYAAFSDCNALTKINLPGGLTQLESCVFSGCSNLTSIDLPEGLKNLPDGLFQYCSRLKKVSIPRSIIEIGYEVFYLCENLTDVYYAGSKEDWGKITAAAYNEWIETAYFHYNATAPVDLSQYAVLRLPQDTYFIAAEAFAGVDAEVVVIPAGCLQIESRAFADCKNLVYVILSPDASVQIAADAFEGSNAVIRYQ